MDENLIGPLIPHTYPFFIKAGTLITVTLLIVSLAKIPFYNRIRHKMYRAEEAFSNKDFKQARKKYEKLHRLVPHNQYIIWRLTLTQELSSSIDPGVPKKK